MATLKETILDLFDLDQMSTEKADELVGRLANLIIQATLARVLPMMSEQDLKEYEELVAGPEGGEKLFAFLGEKVPGFAQIMQEEAEILRQEMKNEFTSNGL